jgi:asparagine synthase (glutamine-hydrolysing)
VSGIGGIWQRSGAPVLQETIDHMIEELSAYGADAVCTWKTGSTALVHCMLRTTPEALEESQPFSSADGRYTISADARLDNRSELLARLGLRDQGEIPDSQLILAAYQAWGETCAGNLLGDFAFVIWDAVEQRFYCARDVFGVRPLYYHCAGDRFVFASALAAVLADPGVPRRLNEDKIADFLFELFDDKARTFYQDILRLPPAHWMVISQRGITITQYWALDPEKELRLSSDAQYAEAYREAFVEAVRCRLRSAVTVGSTLSGGLDSSSVTCVAGRLLRQENLTLHTLSVIFDSVPQSDEREFIQTVLAEGEYQPHFLAGDQLNPITDLIQLIPTVSEPYYSPQVFLNRGMWAATRTNGIGVLLEGLMGDNVVSHGYPYLNELAHAWRWLALYQQFTALAKHHPDPQPAWKYMARAFWQDGIKANLPSPAIQMLRKAGGRSAQDTPVIPEFLNPQFASRVGLEDRLRSQMTQARMRRTARQQHALDLNSGIVPTALEFYAGEAARFGIEPRFPFLDRRLVELCLAIPARQKIKDGFTRQVARVGLAEYLPEKIRLRTSKADISWNFLRGLHADRHILQEILSHAPARAESFFNLSSVQSIAALILDGKGNKNQVVFVFLIAVLIAWLNQESSDRSGISCLKEGEILSS